MNFLSTIQPDAGRAAAADENLIDLGIGTDAATMRLQCRGQGAGYGSHTTPGKTPGTHIAVYIAHGMVQQHIGRTR